MWGKIQNVTSSLSLAQPAAGRRDHTAAVFNTPKYVVSLTFLLFQAAFRVRKITFSYTHLWK